MSFTPDQLLIFAARAGNHALAEERLTGGANPNSSDTSHGSAAMESIRRGDVQMLSLLLEGGLSPDGAAAVEHGGLIETALRHQQEEIAVLLTERGFRLQPHARSVYRERLENVFARRKKVEPDAAPEPPPAAAVLESSETMNPKPQSEAPADGVGR